MDKPSKHYPYRWAYVDWRTHLLGISGEDSMAATADGGASEEPAGGTGGGGGGVSVSLRRRLLLSLETTILLRTFRASFSLASFLSLARLRPLN